MSLTVDFLVFGCSYLGEGGKGEIIRLTHPNPWQDVLSNKKRERGKNSHTKIEAHVDWPYMEYRGLQRDTLFGPPLWRRKSLLQEAPFPFPPSPGASPAAALSPRPRPAGAAPRTAPLRAEGGRGLRRGGGAAPPAVRDARSGAAAAAAMTQARPARSAPLPLPPHPPGRAIKSC